MHRSTMVITSAPWLSSTSVPGRPSPSADPASPVRSIRTVVAPTARTTGSTARSPSLRPMTESLALPPVFSGVS